MKTKLFFSCLIIVTAGLIFGACVNNNSKAPSTSSTNQAEQKSGITTKTGTISTISGKYFISPPGEAKQEIDSYSVDLSNYVGQTVTVSGQFSGNTLFVGEIK